MCWNTVSVTFNMVCKLYTPKTLNTDNRKIKIKRRVHKDVMKRRYSILYAWMTVHPQPSTRVL